MKHLWTMFGLGLTAWLAGCGSETIRPGHIEIRNSTPQRLVFFEVHEVVKSDAPMRMVRYEGFPPMTSQIVARQSGAKPLSEWLEVSWSVSQVGRKTERLQIPRELRRAGTREGSVLVIELSDGDKVHVFEEKQSR